MKRNSKSRPKDLVDRLWQRDLSLWTYWESDPELAMKNPDLANRLGWLDLPENFSQTVTRIDSGIQKLQKLWDKRWRQVILVGMGGSSMAAEVLARSWIENSPASTPSFMVMDSTHPQVITEQLAAVNLEQSLVVIASKSGSTVETSALFDLLFAQMTQRQLSAAKHFVVITDPGSALAKLAAKREIPHCFLAPADVGGRFAALSLFGLLPPALLGYPLAKLQSGITQMLRACHEPEAGNNPGLALAKFLANNVQQGRDKLYLFTSEAVQIVPIWIEQLVAESCGKSAKGVVPVLRPNLNPILNKDPRLSHDKMAVVIQLGRQPDQKLMTAWQQLQEAQLPTHLLTLAGLEDLGAHFFLWQFAVALLGHEMQLNPFDQPHVELAKAKARALTGPLDSTVNSRVDSRASTRLPAGLSYSQLLQQAKSGDYLAILNYAPLDAELVAILEKVESDFGNLGVTVCQQVGPRYLHASGQMHKGDGNRGLFLVIGPGKIKEDLKIPGKPFSFGDLVAAQGRGDFAALGELGRRATYLEPEALKKSCS